MKKIKLKKVLRAELEVVVKYLVHADMWAACTDTDAGHRLSTIAAGSLLYVLRLRLFNQIAKNKENNKFSVTLELHEAASFILYYQAMALPSIRYDRAMIQGFAGKIDKQIA